MFDNPSGIYQIRNLVNNKVYIGQSCRLVDRRYNHFRLLDLNKEHNPHLQNAYNKYGTNNFIFEVLLYCDIENLDFYEQEFVNALGPEYNIRKIVTSNRGHVVSEETKRKISMSNLGQKRSSAARKNMSLAGKGKHHQSEEFRRMQSKRMLGGAGFHPTAKLNPQDVMEIRRLRNDLNFSFGKIGILFGVSRTAIFSIFSGKTWKHIS